jgi:hypothetical protein
MHFCIHSGDEIEMTTPAAKTDSPTVSVCVPTYNYGRFLTDCIESVLQQDFADFELVITDDNSTDGTAELVARFAAADARVRYIKNERRLGMNGNIKRAADLAQGRYIKMLCADDWIAPRCLGRMVELMDRHPNAALGTSACILAEEDGRATEVQFLYGEAVSLIPGDAMLEQMARGEGFGGNSSFFVRAEAYKNVGGYDGSIPYAADYHLAARLCQIGDYLHTDDPLFYGRRQAAASSLTDPGEAPRRPGLVQHPREGLPPPPDRQPLLAPLSTIERPPHGPLPHAARPRIHPRASGVRRSAPKSARPGGQFPPWRTAHPPPYCASNRPARHGEK